MRIERILTQTIPISRYADPKVPSGGLDTSIVALVTDKVVDGRPIVGYGFSSIGRFGQSGLIKERFARRLLEAPDCLTNPHNDLPDPVHAWQTMMRGEKPGGHGERSVAVGTLDMAIWDACAKAAELPLHKYIQERFDSQNALDRVPVYAGGGYYFPEHDRDRLCDEMRYFSQCGFTHAKIKIGGRSLNEDLQRVEAALEIVDGASRLAVDAVYSYSRDQALEAADRLEKYGLWWFEDICDPLDFETMAAVAKVYDPAIAAGEAQFSAPDAYNLIRYSKLRADRDILLFDIAHCYGLPEYVKILDLGRSMGWGRKSFFPHGGHLFTLHAVAGLGLGGAEVNPHNFQPFGGLSDTCEVSGGLARLPELPGIGFEGKSDLYKLFVDLLKQ